MLSRRTFWAMSSGVAATTMGILDVARAQTAKATGGKIHQGEFLFWMDSAARAEVRRVAEAIAYTLDSEPPDRPQPALRLYAMGAKELQQRYSANDFAQRVAQSRTALGGKVRSRVFQGVDGGFRMLPNLPDGEYCIAVFDLLLTNGDLMATEQFTLSRSSGYSWLLANHYIGAKPFYRY